MRGPARTRGAGGASSSLFLLNVAIISSVRSSVTTGRPRAQSSGLASPVSHAMRVRRPPNVRTLSARPSA
jgi:hypothetical protein